MIYFQGIWEIDCAINNRFLPIKKPSKYGLMKNELSFFIVTVLLPVFRKDIRRMLCLVCKAFQKWLAHERDPSRSRCVSGRSSTPTYISRPFAENVCSVKKSSIGVRFSIDSPAVVQGVILPCTTTMKTISKKYRKISVKYILEIIAAILTILASLQSLNNVDHTTPNLPPSWSQPVLHDDAAGDEPVCR